MGHFSSVTHSYLKLHHVSLISATINNYQGKWMSLERVYACFVDRTQGWSTLLKYIKRPLWWRNAPHPHTHTYYNIFCPLKETSRPHIPQEWTFKRMFGQSKKPLSLTNKGMFCRCDLNALLTVYHIWRLAHGWIQTNKRVGCEGAGDRGKQFVYMCVYASNKGGAGLADGQERCRSQTFLMMASAFWRQTGK